MYKTTFFVRCQIAGILFLLFLLTGACKTCNCPAYSSRKAPPRSQLEQPAGFNPDLSSPGSSVAEHEQALPDQDKLSNPEIMP